MAQASSTEKSETDVFINCPFDETYQPLFDAIIYSVIACGYEPRCALEINDAGTTRIDKIQRLIKVCRLGIHDISRTELSPPHNLPRFNMPLELGLFLGAKYFGNARQKRKLCLVLDREKFHYQRFISDISGQDISSHENDPHKLITQIRDWLNTDGLWKLPGGATLRAGYDKFVAQRPGICRKLQLAESELTFPDRAIVIQEWLKSQESGPVIP